MTLLGAVAACDAPLGTERVQAKAEEQQTDPVLSQQQVYELTEQCGKKSREEFRRGWKDGIEITADGQTTADFANHYNVKMNTCFYLLTVNYRSNKNGQGSASASTLSKMLFDINEGELYGEYSGAATDESQSPGLTKRCRVVSLHCGSRREWEVLVEPYMED